MTADDIIKLLKLIPLPGEGGLYGESYRASEVIPRHALPSRYTSDKEFATAMYYLLTPDTFSALHRLPTDEVYHFYLGDPVEMLQLHPDGGSEVITLGPRIAQGQRVQTVVRRGVWQGSYLTDGGAFALLGTTVAPAYDFSDYVGGERAALVAQYSDRADLITRLTPPAT
ncbi:MAG: cupin domain-containing protein [Anaerolineae bacterium]|nr:cupin domain-containing protein [Anaerolineae bacterium]